MDTQVLANRIYISSVETLNAVYRICQEQWKTGRMASERESQGTQYYQHKLIIYIVDIFFIFNKTISTISSSLSCPDNTDFHDSFYPSIHPSIQLSLPPYHLSHLAGPLNYILYLLRSANTATTSFSPVSHFLWNNICILIALFLLWNMLICFLMPSRFNFKTLSNRVSNYLLFYLF